MRYYKEGTRGVARLRSLDDFRKPRVDVMSARQERPDSPLATDAAIAAIRGAFPSVVATDLRYVGSGARYDVFLSNDGWVLRFPRSHVAAELFTTEARTHKFIARILPTQIRLPRVELSATPVSGFAYPIAAHRHIAGIGADKVNDKLLPIFAGEIAILLTALHTTPAPEAGAAGIHEMSTAPDRQEWIDQGIAAANNLRGLDPIVDRAVAWVNGKAAMPPTDGSLHLIHGRLDARHILVNPDSGFIVGVIDWTDTQLGDAARDFVFLVTWQGWKFAEDVLRQYPRALDREFRNRLRWMAQLLSVVELAHAHDKKQDTTTHVRAVHNAFGSVEDTHRRSIDQKNDPAAPPPNSRE